MAAAQKRNNYSSGSWGSPSRSKKTSFLVERCVGGTEWDTLWAQASCLNWPFRFRKTLRGVPCWLMPDAPARQRRPLRSPNAAGVPGDFLSGDPCDTEYRVLFVGRPGTFSSAWRRTWSLWACFRGVVVLAGCWSRSDWTRLTLRPSLDPSAAPVSVSVFRPRSAIRKRRAKSVLVSLLVVVADLVTSECF